MNLKQILKDYQVLIAIILIAILGATAADRFNNIKLTSNPALYFANAQDTISNRTAGTLTTGSTIKAKTFISDTMEITSLRWEVSPSFLYSSYRRTSPTVQQAITGASSNSTIYVYAGTYFEKITLKSNISIIGEGTQKTLIYTEADSCVAYGNAISNVTIANIAMRNEYIGELSGTVDTFSVIKLRNSYVDSLTRTGILFENVDITTFETTGGGAYAYGIKADSSVFRMKNCRIFMEPQNDNYDISTICLRKSSRADVENSTLMTPTSYLFASTFTVADLRCRILMSGTRIMTSGELISAYGVTTGKARMFNNISNGVYTGITNLISSPNNITSSHFYIP